MLALVMEFSRDVARTWSGACTDCSPHGGAAAARFATQVLVGPRWLAADPRRVRLRNLQSCTVCRMTMVTAPEPVLTAGRSPRFGAWHRLE
jgi:hypothetical protein